MQINNSDWRAVSRNPVHFLAFGFGSGLLPKAPGTWGTLVAIPLYCLFAGLSVSAYISLVILAFLLGVFLCGRSARDLGVHDHPGIVWDEFVGFWITMIAIPFTWYWVLIGFMLFRLFDIWKPWPISWADRNINGGLGIMMDDVMAGIYAGMVMHLLMYFFNGWA